MLCFFELITDPRELSVLRDAPEIPTTPLAFGESFWPDAPEPPVSELALGIRVPGYALG